MVIWSLPRPYRAATSWRLMNATKPPWGCMRRTARAISPTGHWPRRLFPVPAKGAKRPGLAPVSRYEVLASTLLPGVELDDARLLPLELIDPNPYQSRQAFDIQSLQDLANSISE